MSLLFLSNVGHLLMNRGETGPRLARIGTLNAPVALSILQTLRSRPLSDAEPIRSQNQSTLSSLQSLGLVQGEPPPASLPKHDAAWYLSMLEGLNFELTYRCNLSCKHCQQSEEDRESEPLMTETTVKRVLDEAEFAGIIRRGVNFTGGEPLLYRPDIFRLLEHVRDLGRGSRLNTNGWWGGRTNFRVGGQPFANPRELIRRLRSSGLFLLAISLDGLAATHDKKRGMQGLFRRVIDIIESCQIESLPIRIIATGVPEEEKPKLEELAENLGLPREVTGLGLGFKSQAEVGAAAKTVPVIPPTLSFTPALLQHPWLTCQGKAFARPQNLHFAPDGRVQTCNFGLGLASLGSAASESLIAILNRFPGDSVSQTFIRHIYGRSDALNAAAQRLFLPEAYRGFSHPCTSMVVIARLLQAEEEFQRAQDRTPDAKAVAGFNVAVARSLGLLNPTYKTG